MAEPVLAVRSLVVRHAWISPALVGLMAVAFVGLVALVDPREPGHYPTCPFLALTGRSCPGCGTLRAVHQLARGDVVSALGFNALTVIAAPLLAYAWLRWLRDAIGRLRWLGDLTARPPQLLGRIPASITGLLPQCVLAFWILRNLGGPFAALAP